MNPLLLGFKLIEEKRLIKAQKSDSFTRRKHEMEKKGKKKVATAFPDSVKKQKKKLTWTGQSSSS